jgi:hypothetical protein
MNVSWYLVLEILLVLQAIVPVIDSPDHSGHFNLFRFPSDAILTFPEAKKVLYIAKHVTALPGMQSITFSTA